MDFSTLAFWSTALTLVLSAGLGLFTACRRQRSSVTWSWAATCLCVVGWSACYLVLTTMVPVVTAAWVARLMYVWVILLPLIYFAFVNFFILRRILWRKNLIAASISAGILLALVLFTDLIISGVHIVPGFAWVEVPGPLYWLFLVYFGWVVIAALYFLYKFWSQVDGMLWKMRGAVLLASIIGFGGASTNFLLPLGILPYGQLVVWLYPIIVTWGVFRKYSY